MAKKRKRIEPELLAKWERDRAEFEQIYAGMVARFEARKEWEARRRARLRRLTFGLLGREPEPHTAR